MKKKTKIVAGAVIGTVVIGISGILMYQHYPREVETHGVLETIEDKERSADVKVKINTEKIDIPEYKEITDANTGEKVIAEVQVNEPIEKKSTTPPEKPKAEGTYKDPNKPPEYKQEQTTIEEKPKSTTKSSGTEQHQSASSGKVYVDGFGYVDKAGETKTQTGVSDGDINKMVGSMD